MIEEYQTRKLLGDLGRIEEMPAKKVDAFCLLDQWVTKEMSDDK